MTGGLYSAEILEALGEHDAAATLRYGFPDSIGGVLDELDETRSELDTVQGELGESESQLADANGRLDEARGDLKRLEALLCAECRAKWTAPEVTA